MGNISNLHFEIFDGGDVIKLEPIRDSNYDISPNNDWDTNWIKTKVSVKGGAFSGQFYADLNASDFELFKRDIKKLDTDFNGTAKFETLEGQLNLEIKGDGLGHFETQCLAEDYPGYGSKLSFTLTFDQTELKRLINELNKITEAFPIKGDLNIKNE